MSKYLKTFIASGKGFDKGIYIGRRGANLVPISLMKQYWEINK